MICVLSKFGQIVKLAAKSGEIKISIYKGVINEDLQFIFKCNQAFLSIISYLIILLKHRINIKSSGLICSLPSNHESYQMSHPN